MTEQMYHLASLDEFEYLIKYNSETILKESFQPTIGKIKQENININFLKKHLFYDIDFFLKNIQYNTSDIKTVNNKVYIMINLKKICEYFKNTFHCDKWISSDYLNFKEKHKQFNFPIINIDINYNTDFKEIIVKSIHYSIYKLLNKETNLNNNSDENYIFVKYDKLYELYINSTDDCIDFSNNCETDCIKIKFNNEFENIFLLF